MKNLIFLLKTILLSVVHMNNKICLMKNIIFHMKNNIIVCCTYEQ